MDNFILLIDERERSINNIVEKFREEMTKIFNEMPGKLNIYVEATTKEKEKDIKDFLKSSKISKYELSDDMLDDVMDAFLHFVETKNWPSEYEKVVNKKSSLTSLIDSVDSECGSYYGEIRKYFSDILKENVKLEEAKAFVRTAIGEDNLKTICKNLYEKIDDELREGVKDTGTMLDVYFFIILEKAFEYAEKNIWRDQ